MKNNKELSFSITTKYYEEGTLKDATNKTKSFHDNTSENYFAENLINQRNLKLALKLKKSDQILLSFDSVIKLIEFF